VDSLSKRSKAAELSFFTMYSKLIAAPSKLCRVTAEVGVSPMYIRQSGGSRALALLSDPVPLLQAALDAERRAASSQVRTLPPPDLVTPSCSGASL